MNSQITIDGITYDVLRRRTPEDAENENCPGTAKSMRELNQAAQLFLQRSKGKKMYFTIESHHGVCGTPVRI